jgi:DDE superfamily endonuclease
MLASPWDEAAGRLSYQLIRQFVYLYGAVCPKNGTCVYLILPAPDTQFFRIFLDTSAKKYRRQLILLFVDGEGNHQSDDLEVPDNVILHVLPAYSPGLNPQENLWDEIREKIFKNYALKSMEEVYAKLGEAAPYIERNPAVVKSITSFRYIVRSIGPFRRAGDPDSTPPKPRSVLKSPARAGAMAAAQATASNIAMRMIVVFIIVLRAPLMRLNAAASGRRHREAACSARR